MKTTKLKKYFLKYLPIPGPINQGDKVLHNGEVLTTKTFDTWFGKWDFIEKNISPVKYDKNIQRAGLFLCTRDIKVGDIVRFKLWSGGPWKDVEVTDVFDDNGKVVIIRDGDFKIQTSIDAMNWCFKIIGQALNEGLKEGQEFTEKQSEYLTIMS